MPKKPGPMNGPKPQAPMRGDCGPGDKGRTSGTRHYAPPRPMGGAGQMTGTTHSKGKYEKK